MQGKLNKVKSYDSLTQRTGTEPSLVGKGCDQKHFLEIMKIESKGDIHQPGEYARTGGKIKRLVAIYLPIAKIETNICQELTLCEALNMYLEY